MKRQKHSPWRASTFRSWEEETGGLSEIREVRDHGGLEAR